MSSKIAKNTVVLTSLQLFIKGMGAVWTFYLARRLGVADYGLWANILALIAIFGAFQGIGNSSIIFKEVSQKHSESSRYLGAALFLFGASALLICLGVVTLSLCLGYSGDKLILTLLAALSFIAVAPSLACQSVLYGLEQFIRYQIIFVAGSFLYFLTGIILVENGFNVWGIFTALSVGYGVMSLILLPMTLRRCGIINFKEAWPIIPTLLRLGWPLALAAFLTEMTLRFDRILIDRFLGQSAVGYYQASFNLTILSREVILIPFVTSVAAKLYSSYAHEKIAFVRLFEQSNVILIVAALGILGPCLVFPDKLIELFYGKAFTPAIILLPILILTVLPFFLLILWQNIFIIQGKTGTLFWINFCGTFLSISANILSLPRFGLVGTAWIAVACTTGMVLLSFYLLRKEKLFAFTKRLPKILLSFLVVTSLSLLLREGRDFPRGYFLISILLETVLYFLLLGLLRTFKQEELNWLGRQIQTLNPFSQTVD